jgi:RNA polymerase-binding transcription factor DksA
MRQWYGTKGAKMDQLDLASDLEQAERDHALANVAGRSPNPRGAVHWHCVECGEEIPDGRRELRYSTCVECQREIELRGRWGMR